MKRLLLLLLLSVTLFATTLQDFEIFSREWLTCRYEGYTPKFDFNKSGYVDIYDLQIFSERWLYMNYPNQIKVNIPGYTPSTAVLTRDGDTLTWKSDATTIRLKWSTVANQWQIVDGFTELSLGGVDAEVSPVGNYAGDYSATVSVYIGADQLRFCYLKGETLTGKIYDAIDLSIIDGQDVVNVEEKLSGSDPTGIYVLIFPPLDAGRYFVTVEDGLGEIVTYEEIYWDGTNARSVFGKIKAKVEAGASLNLSTGIMTFEDGSQYLCKDQNGNNISNTRTVIVSMTKVE